MSADSVAFIIRYAKIPFLHLSADNNNKMDLEGTVISAAAGVIIHVLLALLFLFSTVANVLVIVIFHRRPALRTLSNRFVLLLRNKRKSE